MLERAFKSLENRLLPVTDNWIVALLIVAVVAVAKFVQDKRQPEQKPQPEQNEQPSPMGLSRSFTMSKSNAPILDNMDKPKVSDKECD